MKRNVNVNIMQYELRKKQFKCNQQRKPKKEFDESRLQEGTYSY